MKADCTQGSVRKRRFSTSVLGLPAHGRLMISALFVAAALAAGVPAQADPAGEQGVHRHWKPFPSIRLHKRMRGEEGIQALGDRLPEVAEWYGMTPQEFTRMMRRDRRAWLGQDGRLSFVDDFETPTDRADTVASGTAGAAGLPAPLDQTFRLHSRPGAKRVIYLDFNGQAVINTAWNDYYGLGAIDARPFDVDGLPSAFSAAEQERIQYIWQRVAEDFAPFDVDVTTEEPLPEAISRSGSADTSFGTRVVITQDWTSLTTSPCSCGGIAFVGVFDETTDFYKPAWVFYNRLGSGNEKYVAEAISHEAGHNLGLSHDGYDDGTTRTDYYKGHGSGATGWAPIMGVGYYKEVTQWSKGEYAYATQLQDDLQVIQVNGAPLRTDDHGDGVETATVLDSTVVDGAVSLGGSGVIGSRSDVDVFSFESGAGTISLNLAPSARGPNLDISASLLDAGGNLLAGSNPADALSASISLAGMPAGTYFLKVHGVNKGDPSSGYSDYASLGEYIISGTVPAPQGAPPVAVAAVSASSGTAPHTVNFSSTGSYDPEGGALSYDWDFGDGTPHSGEANPSHTFVAPGSYKVRLTVTDASGSTGVAELTVNVTAALPSLHVDFISMSTYTNRNGTRASAQVKITDAAGRAIPGATVTGSWSGVVSGTASGVTNSRGRVTLKSASTMMPGTFTFTVTDVSLTGYAYDQSQNKETSDSITR